MQRLEVSCAVRLIHTSLGAKWLRKYLKTYFPRMRQFVIINLKPLPLRQHEQLGSRWANFDEILYWRAFTKFCRENSNFVKAGQ